jgi:very-short-patch-repair endonuclease
MARLSLHYAQTPAFMNNYNDLDHCLCCADPIDYREYTSTMDSYGIAMCASCARHYISKMTQAEPLERALYAALINKGVKGAELQYFDGVKTVDIAILPARLFIEIDGSHHILAKQDLTDMWRSFYSLKERDILTLHIPNAVVLRDVESAATIITKVVSLREPAA